MSTQSEAFSNRWHDFLFHLSEAPWNAASVWICRGRWSKCCADERLWQTLAFICACFIILGTLVIDPSKLNLTSSLLQTFTYSLRTSFTPIFLNPSLEISITDGYSWEPLHSGEQCLRFATREYTSKLVTPGWPFNATEAMKACREIPFEIHGKALTTSWCQDLVSNINFNTFSFSRISQGAGRGVFGFWIVDFNEPECETRWGEFNDLVWPHLICLTIFS